MGGWNQFIQHVGFRVRMVLVLNCGMTVGVVKLPLKEVFPSLFECAVDREVVVVSVLFYQTSGVE